MRIIAIESATTVPALSPILRRQASSNPSGSEEVGTLRNNPIPQAKCPANISARNHVPTHAAVARRERSFIFAGIISVTAIGFESERGDRYGREGRSESDGATATKRRGH